MRIRTVLILLILWLSIPLKAIELPCYSDFYPEVCAFLNRYINELQQWDQTKLSLQQKMRDDKFIVLAGDILDIEKIDSTCEASVLRYGDKAYEVIWKKGNQTLLRVAFPVQYELLLGLSKKDIEPKLDSLIGSADTCKAVVEEIHDLDSVAPSIYRVNGGEQYATIKALTTNRYVQRDKDGIMRYVLDTTYMDYTISNLFQKKETRDYVIQVSQNLYGFEKKHFTTSLHRWLDYCQAANLKSYVAIEAESEDMLKVFVLAENKTLNYNHVLLVYVPKDFLENPTAIFNASVNAFIPTHNVANLYEEYKDKPKKKREWDEK